MFYRLCKLGVAHARQFAFWFRNPLDRRNDLSRMKITYARARTIPLVLVGLIFSMQAIGQVTQLPYPPQLDAGFHDMYNLQFPEAHKVFANYMAKNPADPMGPVSDAAAYLFSEFHRTGVLDVKLFTDDDSYLSHKKDKPDAAVKKSFDDALDATDRLADAVLSQHPNDANALFAKTLAFGLRADYACLIERKDLTGFQFTKSGSRYAHQLLAIDPTAYDAYLAVGMENYILGLKPAPVRWLLQLAGGSTDKDLGVRDLELTAARGHYLAPLAKLLLAVAAIRDKDKSKARELLASLAKEFPNNPLYARQLAKIA